MRKITKPACPNPGALETDYKHPDNKQVLLDASYGKCIYCESKISHVCYGDIEHIKPKIKFPELKFVWENLGYVCSKCNVSKGDKFDESTPYINPYEDDPCDHVIAIGTFLKHKMGSQRGELTIIDIDLNRPELLERRGTHLDKINQAIDVCARTTNKTLKKLALEALIKEAEQDKEYSLFVETLFKIHGVI